MGDDENTKNDSDQSESDSKEDTISKDDSSVSESTKLEDFFRAMGRVLNTRRRYSAFRPIPFRSTSQSPKNRKLLSFQDVQEEELEEKEEDKSDIIIELPLEDESFLYCGLRAPHHKHIDTKSSNDDATEADSENSVDAEFTSDLDVFLQTHGNRELKVPLTGDENAKEDGLGVTDSKYFLASLVFIGIFVILQIITSVWCFCKCILL
jgi:hypothetical protein